MRNALAFVVTLFVATLFDATSAFAAGEMQKLDFLQGDWKGEASIQMGPGKPHRVLQSERVVPKLGGKVLLIEGLGKRLLDDGTTGDVVHETIAFISWDESKKTYRFIAHVAAMPSVDTTFDLVGPNKAVWGFDTQHGRMRYTISLTEKGEWHEVGEMSRGEGQWVKFFEMTMQKQK